MSDYISVCTYKDWISLNLIAGDERVMAIGEKMEAACPEAYMNGYNWEAFLNYYLEENAPEILEDMDTDPEAGMYVAYFESSPGNEEKAKKLGEMIVHLMENEEEIYQIVREHGEDIEWD